MVANITFFGRPAKCVALNSSVTKQHILGTLTMKQAKLLTDTERKRLTAVIDSKRHATRNHTAVALSFYAGLRACEIAGLLVGDAF